MFSRYEVKTPDGTWHLDLHADGVFEMKYQKIDNHKNEVFAGKIDSSGVVMDSCKNTGLPLDAINKMHKVLSGILNSAGA